MFYFDKINSKKVLKSTLFNGLEHFFTTKECPVKSNEENLIDTIKLNKKDICTYLKIKETNFICPNQTHSTNIEYLSADKKDYPNTDAIILDSYNCAVYLNFADCTPVILWDSKINFAALIHAGWRGTAGKIAQKTLKKMGSKPDDIIALIGPCICYNCFETSKETALALKSTVANPQDLIRIKNGRYFADLKGINSRQLIESGVKKIDICPYCTCCNNELFYSYRKENKTTSRLSAIIKLIAR